MAHKRMHFTKHNIISPFMQFELFETTVALLPLALFLWIFQNRFSALHTAIEHQFALALLIIIIDMIGLVLFYLPFVFLWRKIRPMQRRQAIEDTCQPFLKHFEEYAEELTDLPPYTICLCAGIAIDQECLLAAQLLKFQLQGLVRIDRNFYHVLTRGYHTMADLPTESERYLLGCLSRFPLSHKIADEWARLARAEAECSPYLTPKNRCTTKIFGHLPLVEQLCKKQKTHYTRTAQGQQLTDHLHMLSSILNIFPQLNHTERRAFTLWDDFLIYAILLEENPHIIACVTSMRNIETITPIYCEIKGTNHEQ